MDIIAQQLAKRSKAKLLQLNSRLGSGVKATFPNVKNRIEAIESIQVGNNNASYRIPLSELYQKESMTYRIENAVELQGISFEGNTPTASIKIDTGEGYIQAIPESVLQNKFSKTLKIQADMTTQDLSGILIIKYKQKPLSDMVSEMEANTSINLAKHNLRVSTLLNKSRYKLTSSVIDSFSDASGVDSTWSTGITVVNSQKKVIVNAGSLNGELYTPSERLTIQPRMLLISYVSNIANIKFYASRDDGMNWINLNSDTLMSLSFLPTGKSLKIKATIPAGTELYGLAYSWE